MVAYAVWLSLTQGSAAAGDWDFTPRLTLGTIWTDNVRLAPPGAEESDVIFQVNPGISARGRGARLRAELDYNMQNLFFVSSDRNNINHQLRSLANAELYKDRLFLDARASIRQVIISPEDRVGSDNVAITGNRTSAISAGVSPYYRNDFGGWVQMLARYSVDFTAFGQGASDGLTQEVALNLDNGRRFALLDWNVNYDYRRIDRDQGQASSRQQAIANLDYAFTDDWSLLARGGYVGHDTETLTSNDGFFWGVGAGWTPGRRINVRVLLGPKDREFGVRLSPTVRTLLEVVRQNREVGVTSNRGRWFGTLSHRTRRSTWSARYTQEVSAVQVLESFLITPPETPGDDIDEEPFPDPGDDIDEEPFPDDPDIIDPNEVLTLTDTDFVRRRFQGNVTVSGGRSRISFAPFFEHRDFETDQEDEQAFGGGAAWNWRLGPRTNSVLSGSWQRSEADDGREDDFWRLRVALSRRIASDLRGSLSYQYFRRDSNLAERDAEENRLDLRLVMTF